MGSPRASTTPVALQGDQTPAREGTGHDFISKKRNDDRISAMPQPSAWDHLAPKLGGHKGTAWAWSSNRKTGASNNTFGEKTVQKGGNSLRTGVGITCRKGLKPHNNQDCWFVGEGPKSSVYAVFDGHGQKGDVVAEFCSKTLPELLISDNRFPEYCLDVMGDTFPKTHELLIKEMSKCRHDIRFSGTTATVVIHQRERGQLVVGNVGDSTAALAEASGAGAKFISTDHKPTLSEERTRIWKAGGCVQSRSGEDFVRIWKRRQGLLKLALCEACVRHEEWPGLEIARVLGDTHCQQIGIIATPTVSALQVGTKGQILVVCSDGIWNSIDCKEAMAIVAKHGPDGAQLAADELAKVSYDRWIERMCGECVDDITALVVFLPV